MKNTAFPVILNSECLFHDANLSVRRDWVFENESTRPHAVCVLDYPDWVSAFALTKNEEVILVQQYRYDRREVTLELPAGHVSPQDTSVEAAIRRELREETGYLFDTVTHLVTVSPNPSVQNNLLHCFLALGGVAAGEQCLEPDENISLKYLPLHEIKQYLVEGKLLDNGHLMCMFYACMQLGIIH